MKRIVLSIYTLIFCFSVSNGQTYLAKQWDHTYGGFENEVMTAIKETNDGGFILAGYTRSDTGANVSQRTRGGTDFWIVNTDSNGVFRWDKRFGGNLEDRLYGVDLANKGAVIAGGFTTTDSSGDVTQHTRGGMDYWVVKMDSLGSKLWDRRFGGTDYDRFTCLTRCSDGGVLAGGFTLSDSGGDVSQRTRGGEDFWIVKMDSTGTKLWDKRYGGDETDDLWYILQTSDGGFLLGGMTNSDSTGDVSQHVNGFSDAWVIKINSVGVKQWDQVLGGAFGENVTAMTETPDGKYLIYSSTTSDSTGDVTDHTRDTSMVGIDRGDMWVVKLDSAGNKLWDHVYGGTLSDGPSGTITVTQDNGIFFGCNSTSPAGADKSEGNFGGSQSWILKTDSVGNIKWDKTVYSSSADEGSYQIQCKGGCYLVANSSESNIGGYKTQNSIGQNDYWMVKFCESEHPQLPTANFTAIDSVGMCAGSCFNFENNSLNAGVFQWFFPGGTPSTSNAPNPQPVCYSSPGIYDVTLIATNNDGSDTTIMTGAVTVFGLPGITIQQSGDTLSVPQGFNYYQWFYNDSLLLNDTLYYLFATVNGDYRILILDSNGCPAQDTLFSFAVGINNLADDSGINVWPNPVRSTLNISFKGEIQDVSVIDLSGRIVYSNTHFRQHTIDMSKLATGIYFLQMRNDTSVITRKIIKQ